MGPGFSRMNGLVIINNHILLYIIIYVLIYTFRKILKIEIYYLLY